MNGQDNKHQSKTTVDTATQTSAEAEEQDNEVLTPLEEKVVRMLRGLSEDGQHELKFALGADEDARLRLAMMEKYLIELFRADRLDQDVMQEVMALKEQVVTDQD